MFSLFISFFVCIWNVFKFFLEVLTNIFFGVVNNVFCLVCFRRFFIPQNVCLFWIRICVSLSVFEISFSFFFKFSPSSYLVLSLTFLKCFSVFFWELSTSSFLLSVLLTFPTVTTFGVWSSLILSLFSLPLHSRNVKARLGGYGGNSGSPNNLLIFFDRFKLIIMEVVGKW